MNKLIALECSDSCCEHWPTEGGSLYCSGEVDVAIEKLNSRISGLEKALERIYDEPSNTDAIIDIVYDALEGEV
jgi:hypothetical protein